MQESVKRLCQAGISTYDAEALRRISMTLHRWHELECGWETGAASWCIARGKLCGKIFEHNDDGKPYGERHPHSGDKTTYHPMADREAGALKRLRAIMLSYPGWAYYVQGDPRGCALYLMPPGEMASREPGWLEANYSRGIAVYK
jgi:hypothetical protein